LDHPESEEPKMSCSPPKSIVVGFQVSKTMERENNGSKSVQNSPPNPRGMLSILFDVPDPEPCNDDYFSMASTHPWSSGGGRQCCNKRRRRKMQQQ
jgi:hypothetical protein